jgi:hypothetical protein
VLRLVNRHSIRHFIAPTETSGLVIAEPALQSFLTEFTSPEQPGGRYYVAKLDSRYTGAASAANLTGELMPVPPGQYDDSGARISFAGHWYRDQQFTSAHNRTLTYSDVPGDLFRLTFNGTEIKYLFTRAENRGVAEIFIDGRSRAKLDMYAPATEWQASIVFDELAPGEHKLEVHITAEKNPRSSGRFVDVDALVIK